MGYYTLRNFVEPLLPTGDEEHLATLEAEARGGNSLVNSFKMSRIGNEMSLLADEESQLRTSDDPAKQEAARLLRSRIRTLRDESGVFATAPQRYEDVRGVGDAASYVAGQVGQAVGSSIDQMATGSAMGIASGVAGLIPHPAAQAVAWGLRGAAPLEMYRQNKNLLTGEAYNEIADDPVAMQRSAQDIRDEVSQHGYRAALLDTLPQLLPVGQISGVAGKALGRIPTSAKLFGEALGEAATETGQQYSQQRAHSALNPERDTSGDMSELINSGLGGFVGGGAMGGMGHVGEKMWARGRTEGDGQNGDVIDLNAPDEKPPTTLESLNGGKSRFNKRAEAEALVAALEGHEEDPAKIPEAAARQKSVLMEELSKLKGKEAEEHLQKVSGISVDDPLDAIENLGAPEFLDAAKFVMQKLHITNAELARMKNNAERELIRRTPEDEAFRDRMNEIVRPTRQEQAIDKRAKRAEGDTGVDELRTLKPEAVDPSAFKFELDPSHFLAPTETGATGKTINERAAANRARLEQAQNKAKVFNARAELVANKLWNAYTDEHGYEVDAEGALEPSRIRQGDPQAVGIIRELAQELTAAATVTTPTPSEERRAQRLAEQLVQTVGTKAVDVLTDINRITGSTMALKGIVSAASSYLGATNSSALKVQHETRDAAAVELTKLIPAEIEMRLAKDHGVDLSSNKDRNDLLDLMEDVADGRTSVPRIKLNKLFSKPVVDAMEEYLGKAIMPRLEGVKEDHIDENDDYGSKTQTGNTEGEHNTEQSLADPRDLTSDGEVTEFDQRQLGNNLIRVKPDSLVFHVSGDKRGSMVKFSDAWKENDDGRLPKLIHPGDGRTLEHVQKLVAKATERLGPEQRDRYVMGNPASKDPLEAAGATSAKKILDDSNVPDDQRLKLMMRYMEQEDTKGKQDFTEAHERMRSISYLESVDRALTDIVAKRESVDPYGRKLSIDEAAALKTGKAGEPFSIDIPKLLPLLTPKDAETAQALWASRQAVNTKVSQEELFRTMAPIVHRAKEVARQHLSDIAPGADGFFAKNPNADLKDYVNDFFSQRYAVVAEQPTDRDYLQMNLAEFNDMAKKGESNLNSAWVTAGDNEAEQAKVKAGMNIIHFKSRHSGTGEVAIPAYKLVKWVREQENAHTDDKRENDTGQGSLNAQHESYLDALKQGITALHMGGLTEGLPWIMNAKGEREEFTPSSPAAERYDTMHMNEDARLATSTARREDGRKVTPKKPGLLNQNDYATSKEMSYRKAGETEVENGWVRTGLGDLPPSLDVGGISYADYKRSKAYGAMHKRGAASSEAVHNRGLIDAKAEEAKNAELSQDEKDVQGEEAVDEAMVIDQGSRTREEERKHLKLMSSVMRAAADHLPKALTVGAAVNKAGKVAEQLWRDYAADREAGLERIFGYVRSMRRPASDDGYEYNKALGELWREFHAADDSQDVERGPGADRANPGDTLAKSLAARFPAANPEHLSDLLSRGVQAQNDPQGRGAVDTATADKAGNIQRAIVEKAAEPKGASHWGVGGIQYAFPLAALLTPRNIANANPSDQATFLRLRSAVAAEIMRAAQPDPKYPKIPPLLNSGQVRKLVNFLSGYNDQQKGEKLDKAKPPGDRALLERSKLAPVATSFVPNGGMKRFLQGLIDTKQGDIDLHPQSNNTFEGENRTAAPLVRGFTTYERERAAENFINAAREYGIVTEDGHLRVTRPEAVKKLFAMTGAKPEDVNHMLGVTEGKSDAGVKPIVPYSRGEGATLAEREAARAEPVASVAGGRSAAKNVSLDYKGETIDHDAEIAALEAEYTARGIPNARGVSPILGDTPMPSKVETNEPSKVAAPLLKNPPKAPARYQAIETAKLAGATHVIAPVSAGDYSGYLGRAAQAEGKRFSPKVATDMTGKVVLVSVPGGNKGSAAVVAQIIEHVKMALDRGAIVRTDIERIATSAYNAEGEGVLRKALIEGGYAEKPGEMYSEWVAPSKVGTKEPRKVATPKADLTMNYADGHGGDHHMLNRFAGRSTMDLIESGDRTATTRSLGGFKGLKKGDVFTATGGGRSVLLRATTDPYRTSEVTPKEWSQLEGWAQSVYGKYNSAWQMRFERVNEGEKHTPSSQIQAPGATTAASEGVGSQNTLQAAIAKHQEYLKNPPEDYKGETVDHDAAPGSTRGTPEQYTQRVNAQADSLIAAIPRGLDTYRKVGAEETREVGTKEPIKYAGVTTVREHPDSGFRQRTIDNVSAAGVTVAIATDFTTAGERLTRNTAEAQGKYLALDFSLPADKAGLRLAKTMRSKDTSTLNVAGNGIYTLVKSGHTQASVNRHVYDIIAAAHALQPITKIVSGGQTGVDIAGAVAARALGIPSVITLPKGYKQRDVDNQDVNLTNAEVRKQIVDGVEGLKNTPSSQIQAPGATTAASEGVGSQTYWARYSQNNYEVSTQGDKRFSALNAKLKDGRTIEEAYQLDVKGYRAVGDDWRLGKGKPPLKTMTAAELFRQYKALWQQWAGENPELIAELREKAAGKVLTDRFASTPVSQARALAEILNETSPAASEGVSSQNTLGAAIAKHQEYLKNPPADYTTERAAAIGTWATKQHARVAAELAKTDDSTDQYDRLDELRFKLEQLGKASAAKVVESTEAEEHERKYGPQGPRAKGMGRSEKLRNERQKLRSTALAELKADWPEAYRYALAHPERTIDDEFELSGEFSKALTELDTELDRAVAQLQAKSDTPHVTQLRERLNTLHESFVSGEGGYDVLYKQYLSIDSEIAELEEKLGPQGSVKRNAESDSIHQELERPGFAATHDSPIRHEGKFDWRANRGKGEGHAAFGEGTYLSTADGVHKSYKDQFTAVVKSAPSLHYRGDIAPTYEVSVDIKPDELMDWDKPLVEQSEEVRQKLRQAYSDVLKNPRRDPVWGIGKSFAGGVEHVANHYGIVWGISDYEGIWEARKDGVLVGSFGSLAAAKTAVEKLAENSTMRLPHPRNGRELYENIATRLGTDAMASDYLQKYGILGHVFASEGGKNTEHPNYVIYDDSKITTNYVKLNAEAIADGVDGLSLASLKPGDMVNLYRGESSANDVGGQWWTSDRSKAERYGRVTKVTLPAETVAKHAVQGHNDKDEFVFPTVGKRPPDLVNTTPTAAQQAEAQAANQFAKLGTMAPPKHIEVTAAEKWFERNVSDKVKLILQDVFPDMKGGSADFDTLTNIARISTANPLRIMRLTYHEGVHAFFNTILNAKGMEKTKELMYRVASDPKVYNRVKELLKGETEALADMERDPEERVAYMFQFYKLGLLDIDHAPKTFFEKVQALMRRVFGAVRDSEKALAIFTAFDQGQLKETSAAGRVIEKIMGRGEWRKEMLAKYDKQAQALYTEVMANHLNFRNSESATAKLLGRMWYSNPAYGADTEQVNGQDGVINRTKFKRDYYSNRIRVALKPLQGPNLKRDLETLAEALNNHTEPTSAILRKAKKDLHAILTEYRDYARQAGLDIGFQIGADGEYWARVYEIEKLINGRETFVNMLLTKHGKLMTTIKAGAIQAGESGITTERDVAEMIHQSLVDRLGVQDNKLKAIREDGVLSPFFASMNERTLEWLSDEDVAPYLSKDVIGTMTQYISQGVRAAEYTRTFGEGGMGLKDMLAKKGDVRFVSKEGKVVKYEEDGDIRKELVAKAEEQAVPEDKREEWIERRMEDLKRASGAMEGSLGKDISATARKLQAGAMTYQILRLLPLMIFSSMLDANGIRVAGGEWEDMFNAYKRGFIGLWNNWKDLFLGNPFGMRDPDDMEKAALASGVINSDMENEEMGEVHSSEYSSGLTRHINHVFFKAIGITQWDRDMRIVATDAARKAIVRDYNNAVPEHSARWLRELGLKKSDIYINDKGQLVVSAAELMKMKNIKDVAVAQKLLAPTHSAVNRWVNRAIVSPNAGLRPTRASDPHFAMFFQFKSFTYAFQETTMRYAMHEAEHGNFSAAARLLHGVPIMIASDMMKAMVTGGGSMPGYMANWTLVDWIGHGINRSGIGGTSTFLTDMLNGNVVGTLAGPTIDHAVGVAGDLLTGDVGGAITQSLPGVKQLHFLRP